MTEVLVVGASGQMGRALLPALTSAGYAVRALSRRQRAGDGPVRCFRGDLATGEGLAAAADGVTAVVHLASAPYRGRYTQRVDVEGTERLAAAAQAAGVAHLVYLSIVGVGEVPWGYYRVKLAAEQVVRGAGLGWTVLRSTQFHTFPDRILSLNARLGAVVVDPGIRTQTVDLADVADRMVDVVAAGPAGRVLEFGGPQVLGADEVARTWLAAHRVRRPVLRVPMPGRLGAAFRGGRLLTAAEPRGRVTWQEYLARATGGRA